MADTIDYNTLKRSIEAKKFVPVYILHGEEGYFIDVLVKMFEELLPEEEKDFNQYIFYAPETTPDQVINTCRQYPMMSERLVVIVKEVQAANVSFINSLKTYMANPTATTILVIANRGVQVKGKDISTAIKTGGGVIFESKKMTAMNVEPAISNLVKEKGLNIEPKSLKMLADYVGTDLSRLYNEINKLAVILQPGAMITPEVIEKNIGISKDYNNFELVRAIATRDFVKAVTILKYFRSNPKNNPPMVTTTVLFNLFSNVLIAFYAADKSDRGMMAELGFKSPYQLKDIKDAMQRYKPWQLIEIISEIRRMDAMSKGVGSRMDAYDLLDMLVMRIFDARGQVKL